MALFKKSFLDENTHSIKIDKLLTFNKNINDTELQAEVIDHVLALLMQEANIASVGLFMQDNNDSQRLIVTIKGIEDAGLTTQKSQPNFQEILKANAVKVQLFPRGQDALPENLFIKGLTHYILTGILSGKKNYGLLKIDLKKAVALSKKDQDTLQLLTQLFVHRWEELAEKEQLIKARRDGWFNILSLELRNITETNEAPKLLAEQIEVFNHSNPVFSLPKKWRFYYLENKQLKFAELAGFQYKVSKFQSDAYYAQDSHIQHFINSGKHDYLYDEAELNKHQLQSFHLAKDNAPASLCIRTALKVNQFPGWGIQGSELFIVIWSEKGGILKAYQQRYVDLIKQFSNQIMACQTKLTKIDPTYLKKTQETIDKLLRKHDKKRLVDYLIHRALSLVPGTIIASYAEVEYNKQEAPLIKMFDATLGYQKSYLFPHLAPPSSMWHRLLETRSTIAVNNTYDENLPKIAITPIDGILSAISIPIFDDNDILTGILNLFSQTENTFLSDQQGLLEWLARVFGSRLREIKQEISNKSSKTNKTSTDRRNNKDSKEIQSVNQLLQLFSDESTSKLSLDQVVSKAIKKVIPHIVQTHWGLFKGEHVSRYSLTTSSAGLKKMDHAMSTALQYSPVKDIIYGGEEAIIADDIHSAAQFKNLIPLFPAQRSCLAVPIKIISYRELKNNSQEQARETESQYALFLFHVSKDHFSGNDLAFLQLNISLLQELLRQRAFQNELDRIMPLSVSGAMAAQVAHEIKNPCQPLANFISVMESAWQSLNNEQNLWANPEFIAGMAQRISDARQAVEYINKNVVHLMNLSDITHMTMSQVSIPDILTDICSYAWYSSESMSLKKENPIQISVAGLPPNLPALRFDKFHLSTILTNLIQNAFQAIEASSKSTGNVILGVVWQAEPNKQQRNSDYPLQIFIKDNGPGISADVKRRMFSPFETTKIKGTGLGCTICQRMMENIGGKIEVDSVLGQGATLRIFFPENHLIFQAGAKL